MFDLLAQADVEARIAKRAARAGRAASEIQLIAVTKTKPAEDVRAAYAAGLRHFGENKVQEAAGKFTELKAELPDLKLHLIGPLQTNKVKQVLPLFDWVHSLDRPKLADTIARQADALGLCPDLLIQVNTGEEPQKAGVLPSELGALVKQTRALNLPLKGLMCIPPFEDAPAGHFAFLKQQAEALGLACLSMGMSADFEAAVELGATHIRVGSALFGARKQPSDLPPA